MKRLIPYLLSIPLSLLLLSCGTESDEPPLVPEIVSIEIQGTDTVTNVYAPISSTFTQEQLTLQVNYSNEETVTVTDDLKWLAKSDSQISEDILVVNGLIFAINNQGDANVSSSFREKIYTTVDKRVHIIPLKEITTIKVAADSNETLIKPSTSIDLNVSTGESIKLEANGMFEDDENITNIDKQIVWTIPSNDIATINAVTGQLNVLKEGTLDVNVSIYSEIKAQVTLNINIP